MYAKILTAAIGCIQYRFKLYTLQGALFISLYLADIYPANFPPSELMSIQHTFCMLVY